MNPAQVNYTKILDKAKNLQLNSEGLIEIHSAERMSILPGERHFLRTFLNIKISEDFIGLILPKKDLYIKYGINVLNDIIVGERNDLQLIITNINIPKGILMISDKERFFGEKTKHNIFIGDKIADLLILPKSNINLI